MYLLSIGEIVQKIDDADEADKATALNGFYIKPITLEPDATVNRIRIWMGGWDAATGECEQTLQGHSDSVRSASFSPDGMNVVSGSFDGTAWLW